MENLQNDEVSLEISTFKEKAILALKQGIIPFLIQLGILVVVILEFAFIIANDAFSDFAGVPINTTGEAENDPNIFRFVYMILTIPATILLVFWSLKSKSKTKSFWIALTAGIIAWQGLGECSWHFGWYVGDVFVYFPKIEGVQGTFILILLIPILIYLHKKKCLPWGMSIFLLSFMCNWLGHWLMLGPDPLYLLTLGRYINISWFSIIGAIGGIVGSLLTLYFMFFKTKSMEERLVLSVILYTCMGMMIEGLFGLGGSLE